MSSKWGWESRASDRANYESVRSSESESDGVDPEKRLLSSDEESTTSELEHKPAQTSRLSRSILIYFTVVNTVFLAWSTTMAVLASRQGQGLNHALKQVSAWCKSSSRHQCIAC